MSGCCRSARFDRNSPIMKACQVGTVFASSKAPSTLSMFQGTLGCDNPIGRRPLAEELQEKDRLRLGQSVRASLIHQYRQLPKAITTTDNKLVQNSNLSLILSIGICSGACSMMHRPPGDSLRSPKRQPLALDSLYLLLSPHSRHTSQTSA